MTDELFLDPQLKYWVLLPISLVMVMVGLVRSNVTGLLAPNAKLENYKQSRENQFLQRVIAFKTGHAILTTEEFTMRQEYLVDNLRSTHFYAVKDIAKQEVANPLTDPASNEALMNMAKGNIMNYIPQTAIMAWVNYFFAGFVIMKLPFPLTDSFKSMLQAGVVTPDLNVRYVSSISWYFINFLGLKPVYSLIMNDSTAVNELIQQQSQQNPMPNLGAPGGPKVDKIFHAESENLQIINHDSIFDGIVDRIIESES